MTPLPGEDNPRIPVPEAARIMGIPPMSLRLGMRAGEYPFGVAVKRKQWVYYINRVRFEAWVEGRDLGGKHD